MKKLLALPFFILFLGLNSQASTISNADSTNYRMVVSFFSRASGIDAQARKQVDAYIYQFEQAKGITVDKEETRWGREGEIDYCIRLEKVTTKDQKKFVKKIKGIATKSCRVNVLENSPCLHRH